MHQDVKLLKIDKIIIAIGLELDKRKGKQIIGEGIGILAYSYRTPITFVKMFSFGIFLEETISGSGLNTS